MARTLPVLVAALLLFAPPVAATQTDGSAAAPHLSSSPRSLQIDDTNVTRGLHLDDPGASNVTTASSDTSALLDAQASALRSRFETYRLEERLTSLESRDAQREALRQELSNVTDRLDALKAEEREARLAYIRGELTAAEFVVALARIGAKAEHVEAKLTYIRETFGNTFPSVVRNDLNPIEPEVAALQGPVRGHAIDVLRGETSSNHIYVAASENGTRLSMLQGRTWRSQTTRWDNFDRAADPVGDAREEIFRAQQAAHPELNITSSSNNVQYNFAGPHRTLFDTTIYLDYGETFGYFDGSSGRLFYEEQELFLDSLPETRSEQRVENGTVLTVNRTYPGGPLEIRLTNETGAPLDGQVRIDGELVGSTGFDGTLWALDRPGTFNVTVLRDGQRIRIEAAAATFED